MIEAQPLAGLGSAPGFSEPAFSEPDFSEPDFSPIGLPVAGSPALASFSRSPRALAISSAAFCCSSAADRTFPRFCGSRSSRGSFLCRLTARTLFCGPRFGVDGIGRPRWFGCFRVPRVARAGPSVRASSRRLRRRAPARRRSRSPGVRPQHVLRGRFGRHFRHFGWSSEEAGEGGMVRYCRANDNRAGSGAWWR